MKKLMIAAFAAASVCAFADIESTNIVGYQTTDTVAGFNFYSPQFKAIGSNQISIQNIKLTDGGESWADNIQILDEGGAQAEIYYFATADESGFDQDGWINSEGSDFAGVELAPGQSVIVETGSAAEITNAGEVADVDTKVTSVAGFNFVGNNSPTPINIQDIKLSDGGESWADNIQILDEGGAQVEIYYFATAEESGFDKDGWINSEGSDFADVMLLPGQGIIVETSEAGVSITLPAAK